MSSSSPYDGGGMMTTTTTKPPIDPGDDFVVYTVRVNEVPTGFTVFVGVYVLLSFVLIVPVSRLLSYCDDRRTKKGQRQDANTATQNASTNDPSSDPPGTSNGSADQQQQQQQQQAQRRVEHDVEMVQLGNTQQRLGDNNNRAPPDDDDACCDSSDLDDHRTAPTIGDDSVPPPTIADNYKFSGRNNNVVVAGSGGLRKSQVAELSPPPLQTSMMARGGHHTHKHQSAELSNRGVVGQPSSSSATSISGTGSSTGMTSTALRQPPRQVGNHNDLNAESCTSGAGVAAPPQQQQQPPPIPPPAAFSRGSHNNNRTVSDQRSSTPSAATTGLLLSSRRRRQPSGRSSGRSSGSSSRRSSIASFSKSFGQNSIGRTHKALRGYVQAEKRSAVAAAAAAAATASEEGSTTSHGGLREQQSRLAGGRDPSFVNNNPNRVISGGSSGNNRITSDAANTALREEIVEGEADFYRQRFIERASRRSRGGGGGVNSSGRRRRRSHSSSYSAASDRSFMPPLPLEALSPEDAADAGDPGRSNPFQAYYEAAAAPRPAPAVLDPTTGLFAKCGGLLDLVYCDYDARRILWLTIPSKLSAVTEPFLKLVIIAIISHFIDTQSMVAYVLVVSFVELTNSEISGAIADTEMSTIQLALDEGGEATPFLVGQYMQLAVNMQVLIGLPFLLVWVFVMEPFVLWLLSYTTSSSSVAALAAGYTEVIIVDYLLQSATKSFMFPFHMEGRRPFEPIIDSITQVITMIVIGVLAYSEDTYGERPTLIAIAVVQVIASCAKSVIKIAYVVFRGWFAPYQRGFFASFTLFDCNSVTTFLSSLLPLSLGSLLELKEWEILTLFVRAIGPGEVATWSLMGVVWEFFEALTAGLGEAGAVRISYYLSENLPGEAKRVSHKVIFFSIIQGFVFGSIVLMLGPNIAVLLTTNPLMQRQFVDLVGATVVASFAMTFALVTWSLLGAQGRFGIATACVVLCRWLLIFPIAAVCVFGFHYDTESVAGSIAVGYSTAAFLLSLVIMRSDWVQYAAMASYVEQVQEQEEAEQEEVVNGNINNNGEVPLDEGLLDLENFDDTPSSNDSSAIF